MSIKLFSIGFTKKTCQNFFKILIQNKVKRIVDTRINNSSQLSGFAKSMDLEYISDLHNISYIYREDMAPTRELLKQYRDKEISWNEYSKIYLKLLDDRTVFTNIEDINYFHRDCFLCSEHKAEECHRSLLLKEIQIRFSDIKIYHL